ncbi:hypothetical protein VVR84_14885 [Kocuria carniphila]|uniref:hypothetical protein n=1 Tax=Kocuria carniphila TaxID=262208 RepID=UPI0034CD5056
MSRAVVASLEELRATGLFLEPLIPDRAIVQEGTDIGGVVRPVPQGSPRAGCLHGDREEGAAMTEQPERPASLARRRPRPAPDEHIDPVDYTPPRATSPQPATPVVSSPPVQAAPTAEPTVAAPKRGRGRPRREPTIQLGVRVAQDVSDLIEEHDGTARAVIENAVRAYAQQLNR